MLILISVNLARSLEACEMDESCTTSNGNHGIVKADRDCAYFMSLSIKDKRSFGRCGFLGRSSLVCCPNPLKVWSRFTRKAVVECEKFGKAPEDEDSNELVHRIVNGKMADAGEFPMFAQIGYRNDENDEVSFSCGGALISANFVLTAAHCCKNSRKPSVVRLGKVTRM